jgi:hypothetical protein
MKGFKVFGAVALCALSMGGGGCTPNWATSSNSDVMFLMTAVNNGNQLDSDVNISTGAVCPDIVPLRLENHFKNPGVTSTGFRHDIVVQRYEVHYIRSDGRNVEGVDVPYSITGNVNQLVPEESSATLNLEVVRRQAKLEPPLLELSAPGGGALLITAFADITLHAVTTTGDVMSPVTGRLQIDFAEYDDDLKTCPVPPS